MKKKLIGLAIFWLACVGSVLGQVTGKILIAGKTDHSEVKVKFVAQSPTAKTDSTTSLTDGSYIINLKGGVYKIWFSKDGCQTIGYKNGNNSDIFVSTNAVLEPCFIFPGNFYYTGDTIRGRLSNDFVYIITKDVTIPAGDSLIIEPGAQLYFYENASLYAKGYLSAIGTQKDSISFSSYSNLVDQSNGPTYWQGMHILGEANFRFCHFSYAHLPFNNAVDIKVDHCLLEYGWTLLMNDKNTIDHCHFTITNSTILNFRNLFFEFTPVSGGMIGSFSCNKVVSGPTWDRLFWGTLYRSNILIENNYIIGGTHLNVSAADSSKWIFRNNMAENANSFQFGFGYQSTGGSTLPYFEVSKNTFTGKVTIGSANSIETRFENNIVLGPIQFYAYDGVGTFFQGHNIFTSTIENKETLGIGQNVDINSNGDPIDTYYNLTLDPEFQNGKPPLLAPGSPAIGAGIDENGNPTNIGFDPTGTCLEDFFGGGHPPVGAKDTITITGIVHQGSGNMTDGVVMAINKSNNRTRITHVKSDGSFKADSLSKGDYLLYAVPNPATTSTYVPTFYVNKVDINQAVTLPLTWKIADVDIYLAQKTVAETGTAQINGRFGYGDGNTDDTSAYGKNWFSSSAPSGPIALSGNPCKNLPILLYNSSDQVISSTISDTEGYFQFGQLGTGEYQVNGQRHGYFTENNGHVQLAEGETKQASFYLVKGQVLGLEDTELNNGSNSTAYPNPFKEEMNIRGFKGQVLITDLTGSTYYSNDSFANQAIFTEDWPAGIYLLKTGDKVQKIMKQ